MSPPIKLVVRFLSFLLDEAQAVIANATDK
jgi:hypothetical protein